MLAHLRPRYHVYSGKFEMQCIPNAHLVTGEVVPQPVLVARYTIRCALFIFAVKMKPNLNADKIPSVIQDIDS
jgi:hypothetical protein